MRLAGEVDRLRRPLLCFLQGWNGLPVIGLVVIAVGLRLFSGDRLPALVIILGGALLVLPPLANRTVLFEDRIESGNRWFVKTVERSAIIRAQEGKVKWGRGEVTGVVVWTKADNKLVPIYGSAPMSKRARQKWISAINDWVGPTSDP